MTIQFTPEEQAWLTTQAQQQGLRPDEIVRRLVDERIPPASNVWVAPAIVAENAAVYVLHCFQKKSKSGIATPQHDIELVKSRLKTAAEEHRKWQEQ